MSHSSSQTFLRELDKKLWTAADKLPAGTGILKERRRLGHSYKITSTGKLIDDALEAVKKENPKLKNVLNKNYTQLQIGPANLAGLIDLIGSIDFEARRAGSKAMARALFQSWFVDFDPVKRNAEVSASRPEDSMFPDSFETSLLGDIPSGWNITTLGNVLDLLETARRPKGGVAGYSSGIPSIGAESIWGVGKFDYSKTKYVHTEFREKASAGRVEHNDVLLYKDGGKPGEFRPRVGLFGHGFPFEKSSINEHVFRMRSRSVGQIFLYFAVSDQRVLDDFANKGGKAAIPGINQVDVRSTRILMPDKGVLEEFNRQVTPWCDLMIQNAIQSRTLANLRDALLPKLLSGELNVNEHEFVSP